MTLNVSGRVVVGRSAVFVGEEYNPRPSIPPKPPPRPAFLPLAPLAAENETPTGRAGEVRTCSVSKRTNTHETIETNEMTVMKSVLDDRCIARIVVGPVTDGRVDLDRSTDDTVTMVDLPQPRVYNSSSASFPGWALK